MWLVSKAHQIIKVGSVKIKNKVTMSDDTYRERVDHQNFSSISRGTLRC